MKSFLVTIDKGVDGRVAFYQCIRALSHHDAMMEMLQNAYDGEIISVYEVPGERKRYRIDGEKPSRIE